MHLFLTYIKESWQELMRVTWPTRSQAARIVVTVMVFIVIFTALLAGLDYAFNFAYQLLLKNV